MRTAQFHCCRCEIAGSIVQSDVTLPHWAARYNTWLLIQLTRKSVVFSFLFGHCLGSASTVLVSEHVTTRLQEQGAHASPEQVGAFANS